jgi:hypothetical protein
VVGRFVSRDPVQKIGGIIYSLPGNNPVYWTDETGLCTACQANGIGRPTPAPGPTPTPILTPIPLPLPTPTIDFRSICQQVFDAVLSGDRPGLLLLSQISNDDDPNGWRIHAWVCCMLSSCYFGGDLLAIAVQLFTENGHLSSDNHDTQLDHCHCLAGIGMGIKYGWTIFWRDESQREYCDRSAANFRPPYERDWTPYPDIGF